MYFIKYLILPNILTVIKLCRIDNKLRFGLSSQIGGLYCSASDSTCNLFLLTKFI